MSNRLFQGLVHQMRDTMDAVIGVVDENVFCDILKLNQYI